MKIHDFKGFLCAGALTAGLIVNAPGLVERAHAAKGDSFSSRDDVANQVAIILNAKDRLPLPIQRVRKALTKHYIENQGRLFWTGSQRMDPWLHSRYILPNPIRILGAGILQETG